jgi:hypothetical protein
MTQANTTTAMAPEARQFDFWIGEWDLAWGENGHGTNSIIPILDGYVIQENFDGRPAIPLQGLSVSTYTPSLGQWQQTWVDNSGTYLDFVGGLEDGRMVLSRTVTVGGKAIRQRMVWFNIAAGSLDWNWERSDDGGQTWQVLWAIRYTRKTVPAPG